jgi:hypothetical protein
VQADVQACTSSSLPAKPMAHYTSANARRDRLARIDQIRQVTLHHHTS